ncbi:hypothetical protein DFH09DRAFT_1094833 [Mycena vulgaris]|nr:hypothetical protein DFH09DRAFT_1094833 [Mycena vulgaris]
MARKGQWDGGGAGRAGGRSVGRQQTSFGRGTGRRGREAGGQAPGKGKRTARGRPTRAARERTEQSRRADVGLKARMRSTVGRAGGGREAGGETHGEGAAHP